MKTYQISSAIGGPLKQSDFKEILETVQICLSHLIKRLHADGHVKDLSLKDFQERLQQGISDLGHAFDREVFDNNDEDEEVYGEFECEFDWPTDSHPKDFLDIFAEASDTRYVFEQLSQSNPATPEVQIMFSDFDGNWMTFVAGDFDAQEGFMTLNWKE